MADSQKEEKAFLFRSLNKMTDFVAGLTAVSIFVVVITQIVGRLIGHSAPWTEEATRFIFIWMIFLGIGFGFRRAESPRVTLLLGIMPKFMQRISTWIYSTGAIGFFLFMIVYGLELVRQQAATSESSSVLIIPMWIIGMVIPLSGLIGILNTIQSLIYHRGSI